MRNSNSQSISPAGSKQDIQSQICHRRLPLIHHARRLRLSSAPPTSTASFSQYTRTFSLAICSDGFIFCSQLAFESPILCASQSPYSFPCFSSNRPLRHRQEPRPGPASRPDSGPRIVAHKTHLHTYFSAGGAETVCFHPRRGGRKWWRGARYGASQRFLLNCALA
jgi:hypothetical protein